MLLADFKALLWANGGNLGSGGRHVEYDTAHCPELFLVTASNFLSRDARLSTCIFNLVIKMSPQLSASSLISALAAVKYDTARLGILVSIVREELVRRGDDADDESWKMLEISLRQRLGVIQQIKPLLPHLPSLPGRKDPLFRSWGFDYPGIVQEPEKYLRKVI